MAERDTPDEPWGVCENLEIYPFCLKLLFVRKGNLQDKRELDASG